MRIGAQLNHTSINRFEHIDNPNQNWEFNFSNMILYKNQSMNYSILDQERVSTIPVIWLIFILQMPHWMTLGYFC